MDDEILVSELHRFADAQQQPQHTRHVERALARELRDRHAFDVFHRQIRRAVGTDAAVDEPRDVRMLEPREDLPLLAKAQQQARRRIRELLDRDALLELAVAAFGQPDLAHAAGADAFQNAIRSELRRLRFDDRFDRVRDRGGRSLHEASRARVGAQQALDFIERFGVVAARLDEPVGARGFGKLGGPVEQVEDALAVHRRIRCRDRAPRAASPSRAASRD